MQQGCINYVITVIYKTYVYKADNNKENICNFKRKLKMA